MPELSRFHDWPDRLAVYLDRVRDEPFKWGTHDCIMFAFGAVYAITGADFIEQYRGTYSDKIGACKVLREFHGGTLQSAITSALKTPLTRNVALAGRGDLVLLNKAVGVVAGRFSWFVGEEPGTAGSTREGLICWPTLSCHGAWKVAPTGVIPR